MQLSLRTLFDYAITQAGQAYWLIKKRPQQTGPFLLSYPPVDLANQHVFVLLEINGVTAVRA